MPVVEIIATGNELVFGQLVDTNSSYIAKRVTELGGTVKGVHIVGDEIEHIKEAILTSLARGVDILVTTGGLGPTFDDRTIQAVAETLNRKVVTDSTALEWLKERYAQLSKIRGVNIELTPQRLKMAMLVEGSEPLDNPVGSAPGQKIKVGKTVLICLPGVPFEMKPMFEKHVVPMLLGLTTGRALVKNLRVKMMEADLAPLVEIVVREFPSVYVKMYVGDTKTGVGVRTDIVVKGADLKDCEATLCVALARLEELVRERGGSLASDAG